MSLVPEPVPEESQHPAAPSLTAEIEREVAKRRTFAIISHPDAGKTTLTEKLLLYAGAVELAGAVRGRHARRHATSDWMELEQKRGVSITSAALEFELKGHRMSLIDTPGHNDFSEDTYRALIAADGVVMVIDAANGVEDQTLKLFEVCRRHRLPILTFVNKFDRPSRDPLELLDDVERTLGIAAAPVNWPIGSAERFRGVYDLRNRTLLRYEREAKGQYRAPVALSSLDDPDTREMVGENLYAHFRESLDVIREAGTSFDLAGYRAGRQTPVFFGSALTNFGIEPFLQALVDFAPPPQPHLSDSGHGERDRRAFHRVRVQDSGEHGPASSRPRRVRPRLLGTFHEGHDTDQSAAWAGRSGPRARIGSSAETARPINVAYAGDIIGLVNPGRFLIGDTLHSGPALRFPDVPRFPAEHFGRIRLKDTRYKQFDEGVKQLEEEGLMQVFFLTAGRREPIVGVVGALQYDVIASRLKSEYRVTAEIEPVGYAAARWLGSTDSPSPGGSSVMAVDRHDRPVILFDSEWGLRYFERHHPSVVLLAESPVTTAKPR